MSGVETYLFDSDWIYQILIDSGQFNILHAYYYIIGKMITFFKCLLVDFDGWWLLCYWQTIHTKSLTLVHLKLFDHNTPWFFRKFRNVFVDLKKETYVIYSIYSYLDIQNVFGCFRVFFCCCWYY